MNIILVVNDNPQNLVLITSRLLMMNYQVVTASLHDDALEIARLLKPDVIVTDSMTSGDGWDIIRQIKQDSDLIKTPVIVCSARTSEADIARAREAGCDDFVTKPYNPTELTKLVKRYISPEPLVPSAANY